MAVKKPRQTRVKKVDTTYAYYNKHTFWNDHFLVKEYINELITDDRNVDWMKFFFEKYYKDARGTVTALSVGCGNGWQDRDLNVHFDFKRLDGYDVSESLVNDAKEKAPSKGFHYDLKDLNVDTLPQKDFYDLAINVAALHHVENMDHCLSQVYNALKPGGYFVHFEYIGPKRNQYSDSDLHYMNYMQSLLPEKMVGREYIGRPSIEVMMHEDPSEAVGSELIIPGLAKYFHIDYLRYYNGGLLYQVLYNHIQHFDELDVEHNAILKVALELEREMTWSGKVRPLFAFIVAQKKGPAGDSIKNKLKRKAISFIERF